MKNLLSIFLLLSLVACSQKEPRLAASPPRVIHRYAVTFAAVKIPADKLKQLGLPPFEQMTQHGDRHKLAAYVLTHSNEFSFTTAEGNLLPLVLNNGHTRVRLLPNPNQEEKDYDALGLRVKSFAPSIAVREENDEGQVYADWFCDYSIQIKQPNGKPTGLGGGGVCGGSVVIVGEPEISPLEQGEGGGLWMLVALNRD